MSNVTIYNSTYPQGHQLGDIDFQDVSYWLLADEHAHTWTDFVLQAREAVRESLASLDEALLYVFDTEYCKMRTDFLERRNTALTRLAEIEAARPEEERTR